MSAADSVANFELVYIGDSLLKVLEIQTGGATCRLRFDAGMVLSPGSMDIFQPEEKFAPAFLNIFGVRSLTFDGSYQLNSTVVGFGAEALAGGEYVEFYFVLTGGTDPDAFMVKLRIVGRSFTFGSGE